MGGRWGAGALLALLITVGLGAPATAGPGWCSDDPVVYVNGRQLVLTTSFAATSIGLISNVAYVVAIPANATATVTYPPGAVVSDSVTVSNTLPRAVPDKQFEVQVTVTVSATRSVPITVTASGANVAKVVSVDGVSNSAIDLKAKLGP